MKKLTVVAAGILLLGTGCAHQQQQARQAALADTAKKTGLSPVEVPGTGGEYLGKEHRGYKVLFTGKAGDVWGRYVARLTMGELGREAGGVFAFLTGSYPTGGDAAGSPLDRLLAEAIGQPLSITMILAHGKPWAPRLDIVGDYANIEPGEKLPEAARLGIGAGTIHTANRGFADRILADRDLLDRLDDLRGAYIRVDSEAVSFFWAGQEKNYSHMINDHGGYYQMLNDLLDDLADIADAIPSRNR